jgi:hypothetical protein
LWRLIKLKCTLKSSPSSKNNSIVNLTKISENSTEIWKLYLSHLCITAFSTNTPTTLRLFLRELNAYSKDSWKQKKIKDSSWIYLTPAMEQLK